MEFVESEPFDYTALDLEIRTCLERLRNQILQKLQDSAQIAWEVGGMLLEVRQLLGYGQFELWLKTELNWSRRKAYNFIHVFEALSSWATLAQVCALGADQWEVSNQIKTSEISPAWKQDKQDSTAV